MSKNWEGLGGPVNVDRANLANIDPTLDSCCEREEIAARKGAALQRTLQRFDVVQERNRRNIVQTPGFDGCRCCYDPNNDGGEYPALTAYRLAREDVAAEEFGDEANSTRSAASRSNKENGGAEKEEEDRDDEFDYLLDEDLPGQDEELKLLEEARRAELEFVLLQRETAMQHGYGVHRQMHPSRVLKAAHSSMFVVLHLVDPESETSASLDWFLSRDLAPKNQGTKFMYSDGRSTLQLDVDFARKMLPKLRSDVDIPALVAIKDGCVVNVSSGLQGLCDPYTGEVVTSVVEEWLERTNVLIAEPPSLGDICLIRPEEAALMDYLATQKPKEDIFECGMFGCEKSFPHTHVGESNEKQDGLVVQEHEILNEPHD